MSNPNKAKGTRHEVAVCAFLKEQGFNTYRPAQAGFKDTGDLHGLPDMTVQCKDWKDTTAALREGTDGARVQARNAGVRWGVNIVKRARRPVADAYAVMTLADFADLVGELERVRDELDSARDALARATG